MSQTVYIINKNEFKNSNHFTFSCSICNYKNECNGKCIIAERINNNLSDQIIGTNISKDKTWFIIKTNCQKHWESLRAIRSEIECKYSNKRPLVK